MPNSSRSLSCASDRDAPRVCSRASKDVETGLLPHLNGVTDDFDEDHSWRHGDDYRSHQFSHGEKFPTLTTATAFIPPRSSFKLPRIRVQGCSSSSTRWVCWGVAIILVLFLTSLTKLSWSSDAAVRIANRIAPNAAVWQSFPCLQRYWGGVRTLVPYADNVPEYPRNQEGQQAEAVAEGSQRTEIEPNKREHGQRAVPSSKVFNPYPDYTSSEYESQHGNKVECFVDDEQTRIPEIRVYEGRTSGFPEPVIGDPRMLGMRHDVCYDRFGRLGPYGLGYSSNEGGSSSLKGGEKEGADLVWSERPEVDFRGVNWSDAQDRCFIANAHRFKELGLAPCEPWRATQTNGTLEKQKTPQPASQVKLSRTAVVIRTWYGHEYSDEELINLRSLVTELSLNTGGEYVVHFLVQLKDETTPIWNNQETYDRYLNDALPQEFRGMGTLWTEPQMALIYPALENTFIQNFPVYGVYRSTFMPLQYFAYQHPEYDYFWNWEMDVRSTGHWYHLFDSVSEWAKAQPRKYLWERNSRFYVPSEHGSWDDFSRMVRNQTEHRARAAHKAYFGWHDGGHSGDKLQAESDGSIWGPERPPSDNVTMDTDVMPPSLFDKDEDQWGVGEDADLITFNPIFDPVGTRWFWADDVVGYDNKNSHLPRRATIITASRLSRKLLIAMHRETGQYRHTMFSEMWPATVALHHGLKAVYVPHAEYIDRDWPTQYLESIFNTGQDGTTGGSRSSVFGGREHNFKGTTWYYNAGFPERLWNRWLGRKTQHDGSEAYAIESEGRMCLPAMLLHPIKKVILPQEGRNAG